MSKTTDMAIRESSRTSVDQSTNIAAFMQQVPVRKLFDQFQYLDKEILPRVEKRSGKESAEYKFFAELLKSLVWAAALVDRIDERDRKLSSCMQQLQFFKERCALLERDIQRFESLEDIFLTDGLNRYALAILKRMGVKT